MKKKNVIILLVIALIIVGVGAFFTIRLMRGTVYDRIPTPTQTPTIESAETQGEAALIPLSTLDPREAQPVDSTMLANMDKIESEVSQLRNLVIEERIPREIMSSAELKETVSNDFLEDYSPEDEQIDVAILNLFGLLPKGFALRDFYLDLYSEQIAGFYDTEEKAMFVVSDAGFGGLERTTYAHEFVHVLQDEHFGFKENLRYSDEFCDEDSERCLAIQSLIEGDAVLTESLWFQTYATDEDLEDLQAFYSTFESPILDNAPDYMQVDFTFAYIYGAQFVQTLYLQGGYDLIDEAFLNQQPVSSEQILHPQAYPDDMPNNPDLPNLEAGLGDEWELVDENVLGEWYTYLVLAKGYEPQTRLHESIALDAAEGWGGDRYAVLKNKHTGELVATVSFNWDTAEDAAAAFTAFENYNGLRFGAIAPAGYWQGEGFFSSLYQTNPDSFIWILAESAEMLISMQELMHN